MVVTPTVPSFGWFWSCTPLKFKVEVGLRHVFGLRDMIQGAMPSTLSLAHDYVALSAALNAAHPTTPVARASEGEDPVIPSFRYDWNCGPLGGPD